MSPLEKTRGLPFFSSCLMGLPASVVEISNFLRVNLGLWCGGVGRVGCGVSGRQGLGRLHCKCTQDLHFADKVERTRGLGVVVHGKKGELVPEGDALLVVVEGVDAVVDRVVLPFLLSVLGRSGSKEARVSPLTKGCCVSGALPVARRVDGGAGQGTQSAPLSARPQKWRATRNVPPPHGQTRRRLTWTLVRRLIMLMDATRFMLPWDVSERVL